MVLSIPLSVLPTKMLNNTQYRSLRDPSHHLSPPGHQVIGCISLSETSIQFLTHQMFYPSVSPQSRDKDVVWDSIKCFAQGQVDYVSHSSPIHKCCNPIMRFTKLGRHNLSLVKLCWLSPIISLSSIRLSIVSRTICSTILPGTEVRLTGFRITVPFESFLKMRLMSPFFNHWKLYQFKWSNISFNLY